MIRCKHHGLSPGKEVACNGRKRVRCERCVASYPGQRRKRLVRKLKVMLGGECYVCGYSRCESALCFHHLDPKVKSFGLSVRGVSQSWGEIKKEVEKCVLLCSNCHGEVHAGLFSVLPPVYPPVI